MSEGREWYIDTILRWLNESDHANVTVDFSRPQIRPPLRSVFPLYIFLYSLVIIAGTGGNLCMLVIIIKKKLFNNTTFFFLANLGFADLIKTVLVMPMSLAILLLRFWLFGQFVCYTMPMVQDLSFNVTMLTFVLISIGRYRAIVHPMKSRIPAGLCLIGVWVVALCVVLPFAVYMEYFDLSLIDPAFGRVGICYVRVQRSVEEYKRAMFVCLYILPLAIVALLYIRISTEFKSRESDEMVIRYGVAEENGTSEGSFPSKQTCSTSDPRSERDDQSNELDPMNEDTEQRSNQQYEDYDVQKERRTQRYMIGMVAIYALCWCPIKIIILMAHIMPESSDNTGHIDITYLTFTFIAFTSTCTTPVLFASMSMSESTRNRLRGYFRFSNRGQATFNVSGSRNLAIYVGSPSHGQKENGPESKSYL